MAALEIITAQATAPGLGAAFAAVAGNSLTLRDSRSPIYLIDLWQTRQLPGFTRITSPLMHDAVVGLQGRGSSTNAHLFRGWEQRIYPQDTLTVFGSGGGAGLIEQTSFLVYYEDLPGVDANLIDHAELERRGEDMYTFFETIATGIAGGYSGSRLVTAEQDQFKANTEYAWLGATVESTLSVHAIRMVGPDFGNLGIGMRLTTSPSSQVAWGDSSSQFFRRLSKDLSAAVIPVINSANKSLTTVDAAVDNGGGDPLTSFTMVRLAPRGSSKAKRR